ncbi:MAG: hypothetical protein LVR00_09590 [Rhabdochlamydiaceae bacterium]|jgi:hypothetical protein
MEIGSISSALMTSVTVARNASRENSPWQQRVKVVVGTPCFLLVASVAVVETVVYAIFAQMALPFCPLTKKPFLFW